MDAWEQERERGNVGIIRGGIWHKIQYFWDFFYHKRRDLTHNRPVIALWQSCNMSEKAIIKWSTMEIDFSVNFHRKHEIVCMELS